MPGLEELCAEVAGCTKCALAQGRHKAVPGDGNPRATIMLIGEGPGYHEDQQGLPFVGPSGQFLGQMLASIGLARKDVYITNVVKCRPPNNRDPQPDEIAACDPYLDRQIALIKPKMIVTLGRFSMGKFFPGETISRIHGQPRQRNGIILFPLYHPAAALHQPALRRTIEEDFKKIPAILDDATRVEEVPAAAETTTQLTLF